MLKGGNLFDESCNGVQHFGNCCNRDDCVLTYEFLCGVLLRMHDRSADGVFHLAILALLKTRQTLICFPQCLPMLPAGKSKKTSI